MASPALSVSAAAADAPARLAIIDGDQTLTWRDVAAEAAEIQRTLADVMGDLAGIPVGLVCRRDRRTILRLLALLEAGACVVTLHADASSDARLAQLRSTRAAYVIDDTITPVEMDPAAVPLDPRCTIVVFTSGSTGTPKGVMLSAEALVTSAQASAENLKWCDGDRWWLDLPLAHVGGLSVVFRCLLGRRTICLAEPDTLVAMERRGVTLASWVPTQLLRALDALDGGATVPSKLRAVLVGGGATSPELAKRARRAGLPILLTWGATEAASQIATQPLKAARSVLPDALRTVGPALCHAEVTLRDGRAWVRSHSLMLGYHPPDAHASPLVDGWLRTNDRVAWVGENLQVLGRADDIVISGGENVSPSAVEGKLRAHPAVRDVGVVGVPDAAWGHRLAAAVIWTDGVVPDALPTWMRAHLSPWERPRDLVNVTTLPRLANGKLDRAALRRQFVG